MISGYVSLFFFNCMGSPFIIYSTPIYTVNLNFVIYGMSMKKVNSNLMNRHGSL